MKYDAISRLFWRSGFGLVAGLLLLAAGTTGALAQETVRIGLATKTWFPSLIAEAAQRQGLFEKQGIHAEITVYQSGAEAFTALAAGAADVISTSPNIIARGRNKGIDAKMFGQLSTGNVGWYLMVPTDSKIKEVKTLNGKKVGITSAGSLSDMLAQWTMKKYGIQFSTIPLGGGLVPNLISHNVDASVVYSPLSFKVMQDGDGKAILDYGSAMPKHLNSGWAATDKFITGQHELLQKIADALYGGLAYIREHRDYAIGLIAEIDGVSKTVAARAYENVFLKLSHTGEMNLAGAEEALKLYRAGGMAKTPPAKDIFTSAVTPVEKYKQGQ